MRYFNRNYVPAKLYNARGDISKPWYVYFAIWNPETGKMHPGKKTGKINYIKTVRERTKAGHYVVHLINQMLASGELSIKNIKAQPPSKPDLTLIQELQDEYRRMEGRSRAAIPTLTHDTCIVYKSALNIFIKWLKKNGYEQLLPKAFTKQHAYAYSDYMIQELKYSGVTYNARKIYLGTFFNALVDREIISVNYFQKIKSLPKTQSRIIPFTEDELEKIKIHLKKTIKRPELLMFFQFIVYLLMRGKEVSLIQLNDITEWWSVLIYGDKGKTKIRRAPTIPEFLRPKLRKIKKQYPGEYYLFSTEQKPGPIHISVKRIRRLFRKYVRIPLGIPEYKKMYHGKHTGVTRSYISGTSVRAILQQGGWKNEKQFTAYLMEHGLIPNEEFAKMR